MDWCYLELKGALGGILMMWDSKIVERIDPCVGEHNMAWSFWNVKDKLEWVHGSCL